MRNQPTALTEPPKGYGDWLKELKKRIQTSQQRASMAVNSELIRLYWQIGKEILTRQEEQGWRTKVIERLSSDLKKSFPTMKGFSARNLKYMRQFAEAWRDIQIVQQLVALLPWGHNLILLSKLNSEDEREAYAQKAIENGWSRNVSVMQCFPVGSNCYSPEQVEIENE